MKRLSIIAGMIAIAALAALAQTPDDAMLKKLKAEMDQLVAQSKVIGIKGSVMNATVKGAPYSAVEVTETDQMLADGTRIHNESQTNVYRDGEGRVRRETPDQITITDPVAGATYFLDPKTQTVRKGSVVSAGTYQFRTFKKVGVGAGVGVGGVATTTSVEVRNNDGVTSVMVDGKPADPSTIAQMKMRGELGVEPSPAGPPDAFFFKKIERTEGQAESLGKQTLEGVESEGTRSTSTLPAGAIGNDRPIQTISERWYSPELQTVMMSRHSDPRSGEETFRLTNVTRGEPSPDLFQVPPTYHTVDKM